MSQAELLTPTSTPLPPITYKGQPVITTEMLAQVYGCSAKNIRDNFANNKERFIEGKHYFTLTNGELKSFRDCTENFGAVVPARTRNLTLYTERGSLQHAKSIGTDETWTVYDVLVETFFRITKPLEPEQASLPESPITPDQQKTLQDIVRAKVEAIPERERHGGLYPQIWTRFKNHFRVPRYTELPQSRMSEAVTYLTQLELRQAATPKGKAAAEQKALPASGQPPARPHPDYQGLWRDTREVHTSICETATILIRTCEAMLRSCHQHLEHSKRLMELEHSSLR